MEEVFSRFPHIGEDIFDLLDEKSLENCKKVCRIWKKFIDDPNQKLKWIQEIKENEKNAVIRVSKTFEDIPLKDFMSGPKPKWSKLRILDLREFVNRLNNVKNESKLIEMFLEKYAELKVELNAKSKEMTIFHWACYIGQSKLVNILLQKSTNLKIDLNAKDKYGGTAFHWACAFGNTKIVKMMIENAESSKLNFQTKNDAGRTAFQDAQIIPLANQDVINLIKKKLPAGKF